MNKIKMHSGSAAQIYETLDIDEDTIKLAKELVAEMRAVRDREIMEILENSTPDIELNPVVFGVDMMDSSVVDPLTFRGYTTMNDKVTRGIRADDLEQIELSLEDLRRAVAALGGRERDKDDDFSLDEEVAALNEPMTVRGFLSSLEEFLDRLPDAKRGSVFLSQAGDGVCVNILVGMAFAGTDSQIKQVNIIVAPTDRELLNSQGTTINDTQPTLTDGDGVAITPTSSFDEMGKEELRQACRDAGVAYGKLNNDGMRAALKAHAAFDTARQALGDGGF